MSFEPRIRRVRLACWVLALGACGGPLVVFPGGALNGPVRPAPQGFGFARDAGTVQLETRPEDAYSVNIACTVVGDQIYVSAGANRARWVEHIEANPLVRLRIDGEIYELRAERGTDEAEMRAFAAEWTQNRWARDPTTLAEVWVYRLEAR